MRLFGFDIVRKERPAQSIGQSGGWGWGGGWPFIIREANSGDWQKNKELRPENVLMHNAVFACISLIASDIAKLRPKLMKPDASGIWTEASSPAFSPVLNKPNRYQNHIQFKESWMLSKLIRGNTYALKQRDQRGVVTALYVLDPSLVTPYVSPDGSVFYQLSTDNLAGIQDEQLYVPASEIIHDRWNTFFHPLCGLSPLYAAAMPALLGLKMVRNSSEFFGNSARPSGILTAPGALKDEQAAKLKQSWEEGFTGNNSGRIAVLSDGLIFQPLQANAIDIQLIDQLRWTSETVASCFHVPAYKIGAGAVPTSGNIEAIQREYYQQCLQKPIEDYELCNTEGLGTNTGGADYEVELDLEGLLRMDSATQMDTLVKGVGGAIIKPDEARRALGYGPVPGGDSVYLQQQNYSLAALDQRDRNEPFAKQVAPAPVAPAQPTESEAEATAKWYAKAMETLTEEMAR